MPEYGDRAKSLFSQIVAETGEKIRTGEIPKSETMAAFLRACMNTLHESIPQNPGCKTFGAYDFVAEELASRIQHQERHNV